MSNAWCEFSVETLHLDFFFFFAINLRFTPTDAAKTVTRCLIRRLLFKTSLAVPLNEHWTKIYFSRHMFLPGYLKSRVEQFYSGYIPGLLTTGDNERTSRWEILHRKLLGLGGSPSFRAILASSISRGHFFSRGFLSRHAREGLVHQFLSRCLAYCGCARSTSGNQNRAVLPKRHDNSLFHRS